MSRGAEHLWAHNRRVLAQNENTSLPLPLPAPSRDNCPLASLAGSWCAACLSLCQLGGRGQLLPHSLQWEGQLFTPWIIGVLSIALWG